MLARGPRGAAATMKPSSKPQHAPADFFGTKKPLGVIPEDGQSVLSD